MIQVRLTINGREVNVSAGTTILEAARKADVYIPSLCHHPDLPAARGRPAVDRVYRGDEVQENARPGETGKGCGLCLVEIRGVPDLACSCDTPVQNGMVVETDNDGIRRKRQENLIPIMARHPHACLTCAQQEGCSRTQCSANVPENERCCSRFGHCELQDVANHIGIPPAAPRWIPTHLPVMKAYPLFERDDNLCIGCTRCVRACRDLRGIGAIGFVFDGSGQMQIGTLAQTLEESGCKFCTACVAVCPTGALMDRHVRPGKANGGLVPCRETCPVHIDVPDYLRLVAKGRRNEAHDIIREKVPFPGILGRVCARPCEGACRRGKVDEPVAICSLKRYAADSTTGPGKQPTAAGSNTGKRVAVIGAGPAGLTAAFYLRKKGHGVSVFDGNPEAGGMMRYGIPEFRLPRAVLDGEIAGIFDLGADFRPNRSLGRDFTLDQLDAEGFDAVFLGVGARMSRGIPLEGCDLPDLLWGIDFLKRVACDETVALKARVLVIGGGNMAMDVAMTALRCGAENVSVASLEGEEGMPAGDREIAEAVAEGIQLLPSRGPERIWSESGKVTGIDLVECTCVFDESGDFCPRFGEFREYLPVDQVIMAFGRPSDPSFLSDADGIGTEAGLILVDEETFQTGRKGVWAGGDATRVQGTIIHAVAAGRAAASAIDEALGGDGDIETVLYERTPLDPFLGRDEHFAGWRRERERRRNPEIRKRDFSEIITGLSTGQAAREAKRCLQCDLRLALGCNPPPPKRCLSFRRESLEQVPAAEGILQLLDGEHRVILIRGTPNLREELTAAFDDHGFENAAWFEWEENRMYTQRESELIQRFLQEHGEMPGGDDDLF